MKAPTSRASRSPSSSGTSSNEIAMRGRGWYRAPSATRSHQVLAEVLPREHESTLELLFTAAPHRILVLDGDDVVVPRVVQHRQERRPVDDSPTRQTVAPPLTSPWRAVELTAIDAVL